MIENKDLKLLNLFPEEIPFSTGRQRKYVEIYRKIRELPPGHAFAIETKASKSTICPMLRRYRKQFSVDFEINESNRFVEVYKLPISKR